MTADLTPTLPVDPHSSSPESRLRAVGDELVRSLREMLASIPNSPRTPTRLASHLSMSRVILSRVLGSLATPDVLESLQRIPGPESLRAAVAGARAAGANPASSARSLAAIDAFASLIRADYGTRASLNTAIGVLQPSLRAQSEASSRYQIHKGMRDVIGIGAEAWVLTAMVVPSPELRGEIDILRIEGALGIERSNPRANIHLCARGDRAPTAIDAALAMDTFCPHRPARTERITVGDMHLERLAGSHTGRSHLTDLLKASRERTARAGEGVIGRRGLRLGTMPDVPVRALLIDLLVPDGLHTDRGAVVTGHGRRSYDEALTQRPELAAELADATFAMDRAADESSWSTWPEWPQQSLLLDAMTRHLGLEGGRFTHHRFRLAHPIPGYRFETTLAPILGAGTSNVP